ncbi:MAG: cytochrome c [Cocleimonas sp.]
MEQKLFKAKLFGLLFALAALTAMSVTIAEGNHKGGHGHDEKAAEEHGGDHHGAGAHWMSPKGEAEKTNPVKADTTSIERGKKSYSTLCSSCHGATALGDGAAGAALNPKPTNLKAMSGGHPDGDFAWKIANGRGAMPAWNSALKENQIWDLVNFIQDLKNENNHNNNDNSHDKKTDDHNHGKHLH